MKNREIKFRAWDKVLNKWNLSVEIDCFGNIQEYKFNGSAYYPKYFTPDNDTAEEATERFILCQFTGLVDKFDKDVYEGDIVVYQKQVKVVVWDTAHLCWVLIWPDAFITLGTEYRNGSNSEAGGMTYDKVTGTKILNIIGNVFEHPNFNK